jgi:type III restriction enzyme
MKPIVLVKSVKIAQSEEDRAFFDSVVSSLRPDDLNRLKELAKQNINHEHEILNDMFTWLKEAKNGFVTQGDWEGLNKFVSEIRASFAHDNTLIYNSQKKEKAELLPLLDSPRNTIRAIFSVNALNEGWDVLSLYDIIHFDISESKKVSLQDIQLIGRGARYFPYELPRSYKPDDDSNKLSLDFAQRNLEFDIDRRKFDNAPFERGRVLETFVYHFVKTGMFSRKLTA